MIDKRSSARVLFIGLLCSCLLGTSCQNADPNAAATDQNTETTTDTDTPETENQSVESDPKPARLSPTETVSQTINGTTITIEYGAPSVRERAIWGDLVPYGSVWRTGANEATWISVDHDVTMGGNDLAAGKYGLFTVPGETEWEIVINKVWDQWGAYDHNEEDDLFRFAAQPMASEEMVEKMSFEISEAGEVTIAWDQVKVSFTVEVPSGEGA